MALAGLGRTQHRVPRPWWPKPPWRLGSWLRERPKLHIASATIEVVRGLTVLESAQANLIVQRNLSRTRHTTTLRFDAARLELRQQRGKNELRWSFVPKEAGGFLALPLAGGANDHVHIQFVGNSFPLAFGELVDFEKPYELVLIGVEAEVEGRRRLSGTLEASRFFWPGSLRTPEVDWGPATHI